MWEARQEKPQREFPLDLCAEHVSVKEKNGKTGVERIDDGSDMFRSLVRVGLGRRFACDANGGQWPIRDARRATRVQILMMDTGENEKRASPTIDRTDTRLGLVMLCLIDLCILFLRFDISCHHQFNRKIFFFPSRPFHPFVLWLVTKTLQLSLLEYLRTSAGPPSPASECVSSVLPSV